jgi:hypothetical protein
MSEQVAPPTAAEKTEYWRWQENCWVDESKNWRDAKVVTCGIDVGSVSSQAVIVCDGELYGYNSMRTGNNSPDSAHNALKGITERCGMTLDDIHFAVGTGYGRVNVPFANKAITEIACHARGANYMGGNKVRKVNLFSRRRVQMGGILGHAQVIEDEPGTETEPAHEFGDGLGGFLERLEDTDGEATQSRDVFGAKAGSNARAILVVVPVDDVMHALDGPVAAIDGQHLLGGSLLGAAARDAQNGLASAFARLLDEGFALDQKDLADVGEVEIGIEC